MTRASGRGKTKNKPGAEQLELAETAALERTAPEPEPELPAGPDAEQLAIPGVAPDPAPCPERETRPEREDAETVLREYLELRNNPVRRAKRPEPALARFVVPEKLRVMAGYMPVPLYVVGGAVRNFLLTGRASGDWDIAAPCRADIALEAARQAGLRCAAVYPRTETFRLKDGADYYEFTAFRTEEYAPGGGHTPAAVSFTQSIEEDALRRDFKCNAVYYDVRRDEIADPLGGKDDVLRRQISTTRTAREVFGSDGLRLMRLARFAGELGFEPDAEALEGAERFAGNILDIAPERIYDELTKILAADGKYWFSPQDGQETGLKILDRVRVLDRILPELTAGRGMAQRPDFHKYDVLAHSLRAVRYAHPRVRLAALLHDVGKPAAFRQSGRFYGHETYGGAIAAEILARLKAPARVRERVAELTALHMYDLDGRAGENKLRIFFARHRDCLEELMLLKQADYRGCRDASDECPTLIKWRDILDRMRAEGAPFSPAELAVSGKDLSEIGYRGREIGEELGELFRMCVLDPALNQRDKLLNIAGRAKKREETP